MCVTAFYFNPQSSDEGYRFIIAFNRDEFFNRPTKTADFWPDNPNVVSSVDMEAGKEGGTWLGMSRTGRVAFILNVLQLDGIKDDAKGRGALVSDFLTGEQRPEEYLLPISKEGDQYNGFNLFTIDLSNEGEACYYSNISNSQPQKLQPGVYGVSNSTLEKPWSKATYMKDSLSDILQNVASQDMEGLTEKLLQVLQRDLLLNGEQFTYKPGMTIPDMRAVLPQMVHVKSPGYGTRTNTVILIDAKGEVLYTEKSLREPIDAASPQWDIKRHKFTLTCNL